MTLIGMIASIGSAEAALADCPTARRGASVATLPEVWAAAVDVLIRSTGESGHPWSCTGGAIDIELGATGGLLRVTRQGEQPVSRRVALPEDVLPLGQALLAMPLPPSRETGEPASHEPTPAVPPAAKSDSGRKPAPVQQKAATGSERTPTSKKKPDPQLLLGGGIDAQWVGGSDVMCIGPALGAAVPLGRWLPAVSLRQLWSISAGGPAIDETSVAFALAFRFPLSTLELRTGLEVRAAVVHQDLPRQRGEDLRVGAMTALAIPMLQWANVLFSAGADVVAASRATSPVVNYGGEAPRSTPRPFPTYTVGGTATFEVLL